jgi:hypothetical protein
MRFRHLLLLTAVLLLAAGCTGGQKPIPAPVVSIDREIQEMLLTEINYDTWMPMSFIISQDLQRMAYVNQVDGKQVIVVNGKEEKRYEQVSSYFLKFSSDGKRLAYVAHDNENIFAVVDGQEGKPYDDIGKTGVVFSPDSRRVAFAAQAGGKWFVVVDGVEGRRFDEIVAGTLVFTPDNKELAYIARIGGKMVYQVGDKGGKPYSEIRTDSLLFSPDGQHVAYIAQENDKWFVVKDGTAEKQYDEVRFGSVAFSPDSQHMIYAARSGNKWFAVLNGKESDASFDDVDVGKYSFSHDSKRLVYSVASGGKAFVIVDGSSAIFSPNNQRLAYVAGLKGCTHSETEREQDKKSHLAEEEDCVVVDGIEGKPYNLVWEPPVFSPDSKQIAYFVWIKEAWYLVKDSIEYPQKYDAVGRGTLIFTPDSKHLAFVAKSGDKWSVVVDGQLGKQYEGIVTLLGGKIFFDANNRLHYIAVESGKVLLVEEKITERSAKP